jgi:hypothetical protein
MAKTEPLKARYLLADGHAYKACDPALIWINTTEKNRV